MPRFLHAEVKHAKNTSCCSSLALFAVSRDYLLLPDDPRWGRRRTRCERRQRREEPRLDTPSRSLKPPPPPTPRRAGACGVPLRPPPAPTPQPRGRLRRNNPPLPPPRWARGGSGSTRPTTSTGRTHRPPGAARAPPVFLREGRSTSPRLPPRPPRPPAHRAGWCHPPPPRSPQGGRPLDAQRQQPLTANPPAAVCPPSVCPSVGRALGPSLGRRRPRCRCRGPSGGTRGVQG